MTGLFGGGLNVNQPSPTLGEKDHFRWIGGGQNGNHHYYHSGKFGLGHPQTTN